MIIYVILLIFAPILSIPVNFIALLRTPKGVNAVKHACLFAIGLAFLAFHVIPDMGMDLYRYYLRMDQMLELQTLDAIRGEISSFNIEFISYYLMFIISKTGLYGLYPALSVAFTYSICLGIAIQVARVRNYTASETRLIILLLLAWLSSDAVVSGIRYNMAFSVLLLAVYYDYFLKKKNILSYSLYFATLLIHSSFIVFVFFRIILPFLKRYKLLRYIVFSILVTWSLYFGFIADIANNLSFYNDGYLTEKLEGYSVTHEGGRIGKYIVRYAKLLMCTIISIVLIKKKETSNGEKTIELFNTSNALLVVGSFNRLIYVSRFFQVFTSFVPFYIIEVIRDIGKRKKMLFYLVMFMCSLFFIYDQQSILSFKLSNSFIHLLFTPIFFI